MRWAPVGAAGELLDYEDDRARLSEALRLRQASAR